jgi:hypothetical protein
MSRLWAIRRSEGGLALEHHIQRQKFIAAYIRSGNATQSAIEAGYSPKSARVQGSRLLTYPEVRAAIEAGKAKAQAEAGITAVEVLRELATLALSNIRHFVVTDQGFVTLAEGAPPEAWRAVSRVKYTTRIIPRKDQAPLIERTAELALWDKNVALTNLAKHFNLLVERHEVNITEAHLLAIRTMSDLELSAVLAAMDAKTPEVALQLIKGGKAE